eukprot:m.56239 g.56239  ORF g.56239 m.56239 type:complete len:320 (-) comp9294_c0_seq4:1298-2257(-)
MKCNSNCWARDDSTAKKAQLELVESLPEKLVLECLDKGALRRVRGPTVSPLDVLVVERRGLVVVHQLLGRLASVPWMDAIVAGGGGEEDGGIRHSLLHVLVRRVPFEVGPLFGDIRIAILAHPRRSCEQLRVPPHVQQRHLTDDGAPLLGSHCEHVSHEQPPIRASHAPQMLRRRHFPCNQVVRTRDEVLIRLVALLLEGGLVPGGAKFSASPNVRHGKHSAALEPPNSKRAHVRGLEGDFEAAVAVEDGGCSPVERQIPLPHQKVRHFGPVEGCCFVLLDHEAVSVELSRKCLDLRSQRRLGFGGTPVVERGGLGVSG